MTTKKFKMLPVEKAMHALLDRVVDAQNIRPEEIRTLCRWVARDHDMHGALNERLAEHPDYFDRMAKFNDQLARGEIGIPFGLENRGIAQLWSWYTRGVLSFDARKIAALRSVIHIAFVGVDAKPLGMRWYAAPIYRVFSDAVDMPYMSFDYAAWGWQSGVKPYFVG